MRLKLLWWAFEHLLRRVPPVRAALLRERMEGVVNDAVEAAAEGAVRGMREP